MKHISGKRMVKLLEERGWTHVATKGSHFKLVSPSGQIVIVPVHGNDDLRTGTQRSIMRDAGLADDDLTA